MEGLVTEQAQRTALVPSVEDQSRAISVELRRVARKARTPRAVIHGGGGFRARRSDKLFSRFLIASFFIIFAVPTLLGAAYFIFIAADQYESETRFYVRSDEAGGVTALSGLASMLGGQSNDASMMSEYVQSRSAVEELAKKFDFNAIFGRDAGDFFASLQPDATAEEKVRYWKRMISVDTDRSSGLVSLKVRTFRPEDSLALARELTTMSEIMLNRLTSRAEGNVLVKARDELQRSRANLEQATREVRDARDAAGILDVDIAAKAFSEIVSALNIELSKVNTQIESLTKTNAPDAPQLVFLKSRQKALTSSIKDYEDKIAGKPTQSGTVSRQTLADVSVGLSEKDTELKVTQREYERAVAAYETARLTSERQRSYLLTYVLPHAAEKALYPKRTLMCIGIAVVTFILWAVIAGLALQVRDHMAG